MLKKLLGEGKISKINEFELQRYINFFENSYKDNLEHCKTNIDSFPRWSIISGYYAMHDITKLFLVKKFMIKIEFEVHSTTIKVLKEVIMDELLISLLEKGYEEFITLANDLAKAREERTKSQYYTGTEYMKERYMRRAKEFYENVVVYVNKIKELLK